MCLEKKKKTTWSKNMCQGNELFIFICFFRGKGKVPSFLFLRIFFQVFFYFFLPSVLFSGSGAPVLPWISKPCPVPQKEWSDDKCVKIKPYWTISALAWHFFHFFTHKFSLVHPPPITKMMLVPPKCEMEPLHSQLTKIWYQNVQPYTIFQTL